MSTAKKAPPLQTCATCGAEWFIVHNCPTVVSEDDERQPAAVLARVLKAKAIELARENAELREKVTELLLEIAELRKEMEWARRTAPNSMPTNWAAYDACPYCGAEGGAPCHRVEWDEHVIVKHPHPEREVLKSST